ncbi:MipA/OmpV family protein [Sedimentisphaera salicampi]|uniref:MipA/OmpV family protein n=1 Tax=Sedimentisphaera salicampi TaxID=1941349 RepID=UPI000B9BEDE2|nr:MipA/OmpV family protein [Sedimentisphaera salicampi]OXU15831.1 MltA-interacting protein precursor [Sedimentisphaera salicampi]
MRLTFAALILTVSAGLASTDRSSDMADWESFLSDSKVSVGVGAVVYRDLYKGTDTRGEPVPAITAEFGDVFISGRSFGYTFAKTREMQLDAVFKYRGEPFETYYSDALEGLDRNSTLEGGLAAKFTTGKYVLGISAFADLLSEHQGYYADIYAGRLFRQANLMVLPKLGLNVYDDNYNRYYYGVLEGEAKAGRPEYSPSGSVSPYGSVFAQYSLNEKWSVFGSASIQFADDTVRESPIVGRDYSVSTMMGVSYSF